MRDYRQQTADNRSICNTLSMIVCGLRSVVRGFIFVSCLWSVVCGLSSSVYAVDDRDMLMEEAKNLSWEKKYDESTAIYKKLLERNPDDIEAAIGHGRVTAWSGEYEKAVEIYEVILTKHPNNREALLEMSRVFFWQKKYEQSLQMLDRLLEIDPENQEALKLKKQVEDAKKAVKHFYIRSGFEYQQISFASNAPGAHLLFSYREPKKWEVRAGFDYINKFGDSAPGYRVGGSYWATEGTVLSLDVEFAPKQIVVPQEAVTFEVSQKLFEVLVPSLSLSLIHI